MGDIQTIRDDLMPEERDEQDGPFVIDTLERAEWAMRKIARAEARVQERRAVAAKLVEQIRDRLDAICKHDLDTVDYMTTLLRPWAEVEIAKNGKRKSLPLLGGTVGFRTAPDSLEVTDAAAAIAWIKQYTAGTECIRVKEEIDKREVKKLIEFSGEIPDGVQMKKGDIRFYVEAELPEIEGNGKKEVTNG